MSEYPVGAIVFLIAVCAVSGGYCAYRVTKRWPRLAGILGGLFAGWIAAIIALLAVSTFYRSALDSRFLELGRFLMFTNHALLAGFVGTIVGSWWGLRVGRQEMKNSIGRDDA